MDRVQTGVIIGNSDGIGLVLTRLLLDSGWALHGFSRRSNEITHPGYTHTVIDVTSPEYAAILASHVTKQPDICVYCPGVGNELNLEELNCERHTFDVNLMGAIQTIGIILPLMVEARAGHIIVLSSIADVIISDEAPAYAASKAALSSYVEGLALAVREMGPSLTNMRFGFVDTKMAKGTIRPFMMTTNRAVEHIQRVIDRKPVRYTRPRIMGLLARIQRLITRCRM